MELMAKLKSTEHAKPKSEGFKPDSATSDATAEDFKSLQAKFIANPKRYAVEYRAALAKRGK
jgi:hypothetical protein